VLEVEKLAAALLEILTSFSESGYTRKGFEAKALFKTFDRNRIWTDAAFNQGRPGIKTRREVTKKAINLLVKRGRIICTPVLATYRRYKGGKPYRPVKHYVYNIVDNALDLLVMSIKKDESGREKEA